MKNFASVLISTERSNLIDPTSDIYGRLLGEWKLKMIDYDPNTRKERHHTGIWYFSRTLEGRAIQDVLVSPEFSERSDASLIVGNRYGTSFRFMDPVTHQWTVDWFNPVSGIHNHLNAWTEEDRIIQETTESVGTRMRWIFENITDNSFHWFGEISNDGGKSWVLSVEFFASKISA